MGLNNVMSNEFFMLNHKYKLTIIARAPVEQFLKH